MIIYDVSYAGDEFSVYLIPYLYLFIFTPSLTHYCHRHIPLRHL